MTSLKRENLSFLMVNVDDIDRAIRDFPRYYRDHWHRNAAIRFSTRANSAYLGYKVLRAYKGVKSIRNRYLWERDMSKMARKYEESVLHSSPKKEKMAPHTRSKTAAAKKIQKAFRAYRHRKASRGASAGGHKGAMVRTFRKYSAPPRYRVSKPIIGLKKEIEASGQHNDMDRKTIRITLGAARPFYKAFGTFYVIQQRQFLIETALSGTQGYGDVYSIGSAKQIAGTPIASGTTLAFNENRNNYFDYNPNQTLTGGQASGLDFTLLNPRSDKIVMKRAEYDMSIYNGSTISTEVYVIFLQCMRNTADKPTDTWVKAMANQKLNQANATLPSAVANLYSFVEGAGNPAFYGSHPNQYAEFRKFWKVVKSEKVILPSGNTHRIKAHIAINKIYDKAYALTCLDQGQQYIKGYSIVPIVISRGAIVVDTASTPDSYTYGNGRLGVVTSVKHVLTSLGVGRVSYQRMGAAVVGTGTGLYQFNDVDVPVAVSKL